MTVALPSGTWQPVAHHHLEAGAVGVVNGAAQPDAVRAGAATPPRPQEGQLTVAAPPASWHLLRFSDRAT